MAFNVLKVGVRPTQWRGLPQLKLSDSSTVPQLMISLRSFTTNHHDVEVQAETLVVIHTASRSGAIVRRTEHMDEHAIDLKSVTDKAQWHLRLLSGRSHEGQ